MCFFGGVRVPDDSYLTRLADTVVASLGQPITWRQRVLAEAILIQ